MSFNSAISISTPVLTSPSTKAESSGLPSTQIVDWSPPAAASVLVIPGTGSMGLTGAPPDVFVTPASRLYPQAFDDGVAEGKARIFIVQSIEDVQTALEAFGNANLEDVGQRLALVATSMAEAHKHTEFNESLGAVLSFVRRAALRASGADQTRATLNALLGALNNAASNPMLDLDDASQLVDSLTNEGWKGELEDTAAFLTALFEPEEDTTVLSPLIEETRSVGG